MIQIMDKSQCSGCHACASVCPQSCITMVRDEEGFLYPKVEEDRCVHCGLCEKCCPILTPFPRQIAEEDLTAYAAYTKDKEIRLASSSGGLFTELASTIIAEGGVVFGAAFDSDFQVEHTAVETIAELGKLRGSKYVQSTIGSAYKDAKDYLDAGRAVLFSGTPCQIGGLYSYLKKEYEKLVTVDLICHGVPSPMIWGKYLSEIGKAKDVQFRNKNRGWRDFSMYIQTDKKTVCESLRTNAMMKVFLKNMCLRPSCYNCSFKGLNRKSDITLADFWGINSICPEMNDNKGTSLVITNTQKAERILNRITAQIVRKEVDPMSAISKNRAYDFSANCPDTRAQFMTESHSKQIQKLAAYYCREKWITRVKRAIKALLVRWRFC